MAEATMDRHDEPPAGVEVFKVPDDYELDAEEKPADPGWYFWYITPGEEPGDAHGPYESRQDAIDAAWEQE